MKIAYFTERPYRWIPEDEVLKNKAFFAVSNTHFDREKAADDYNYFLDEYCYAEELGFDAVALNEHHGNPFCMGSVMNVEASILARITKKVKIVLIGNPLPVIKHPLRMAEELAEIDLISRGRLITGWVRGAGSEQFFNNANPAYNREMFKVSNEDRMTSMRLTANEVAPALREYAKEMDLLDSFQRTPGSVVLQTGAVRIPVSDRGPMEELDLR